MRYSPGIDGLRAIAVVAVLLFHLGVPWLPGGALGVDVFFVISGYLITRLLLSEMNGGHFSLATFYERRAKRILPALFVMLIATSIAAWWILDVTGFRVYCRNLCAVAYFGSNFYSWHITQGYFAASAQQLPLLHTWSLSVEEQFYIVYPVVLFCLHRWMTRWLWRALFMLFIASLIAFAVFAWIDPDASFYHGMFRCWELLAGALLASRIWRDQPKENRNSYFTVIGLLLILLPFILFRHTPARTVLCTMSAIAGACCLIGATQRHERPASMILGNKAMVFTGKISYSLYLWHWPLIVFVKQVSLNQLSGEAQCTILLASFVLAALSWRFVEQPVRKQDFGRTPVLVSAVICLAMIFAAGQLLYRYARLSNRSRADRLQAEALSDPVWERYADYPKRFAASRDTIPLCRIGDTAREPTFVVWGDSHARALAPGIDSIYREQGYESGYLFTHPAVPPALAMGLVEEDGINERILAFIAQHPSLRTVVLCARWRAYDNRKPGTYPENAFRRSLRGTVNALLRLNKRVVLMSSLPEVTRDFNSLLTYARFHSNSLNDFSMPASSFGHNYGKLNAFLTSLSQPGVEVLHPDVFLRAGDRYLLERDGHLLYRDYNHVSRFAAADIARALRSYLE